MGALLSIGCGPEGEPLTVEEAELNAGQNLTSDESTLGVYRISTYDGSMSLGGCTATLLYTSKLTSESWLVTSAHCFSHISYFTAIPIVNGNATEPRAAVIGANFRTDPSLSTVHIHDNWLAHPAWLGPRDVAFIHVEQYIPIFASDGRQLGEYHRAIYTGPPAPISAPDRWVGGAQLYDTNVFCGRGNGDLWCDKLSNLWFSPNFMVEFLQLPQAAWKNKRSNPPFEPGDSGGPLLMYSRQFASRPWQQATWGNLSASVADGVVLGVLQGPTVLCDLIQNGNCNPLDGLAAHFSGMSSWIQSLPRGGLIPRIATLTAPSLDWRTSDLDWDISYSGGDYASLNLPAEDPGLCRDACSEDSRCNAFTYVPPGVQGPTPRCWLKDVVRPAVQRSGRVSGVIRGGLESNTDRWGADYASIATTSPAVCRSRCAEDSRCVAYTHVAAWATCYLKDAAAPAVQNSNTTGMTSGLMRLGGLELSTDHPGGDYRGFWASEPNPRICQRVCVREAQCKAFTYVAPGIQGAQARCWLKHTVPGPVLGEGRISGIVR